MKVIAFLVFQLIFLGVECLDCNPPKEENWYIPTTRKAQFFLREAELMAMEASDSLLPNRPLTTKIRLDMEAIRAQYPMVRNITHRKKWAPGKLRFQNITSEDLRRINESDFGPVRIRHLNLKYRVAETAMNITYLNFPKLYNPMVLGPALEELLDIESEPVTSIFKDGDDTLLDLDTTVYTFIRGSGRCFISCEQKQFWHFKVKCNKNREATLLNQYTVSYNTVEEPEENKPMF